MGTARPTLLPLDCAGCGRALPALEADLAFACAGCARAWELRDGRLAEIRFAQVEPAPGPGATLNLPVWAFPAAAEIGGGGDLPSERRAELGRARARAAELRAAYVLAAAVPRADVFGDWGHRWTALQPEWRAAERARPVVGASIAAADARALAEHYVLDLLDRQLDLRFAAARVSIGEPTLLALPVRIADDRLHSPWGADLTLPVRALDGYHAMLEAAGR